MRDVRGMWMVFATALAVAGCSGGGGGTSQAVAETSPGGEEGEKSAISTPTLSVVSATQASIAVEVCAGETGLPAGFSIEWTTAAALVANGGAWASPDDEAVCKASFSGSEDLSQYDLGPGECVTVSVGDVLPDVGACTDCPDALVCGTDYVFRAFGHAYDTYCQSEYTCDVPGRTDECGCDKDRGCTLTWGFWKTHGPTPTGNNENEWPVTSLTLGTVPYTDLELQAILDTPPAGNGLISLAHQLIAAKLNVAAGADDTDVAAAIAAADALIGSLVIPPIGSGFLSPGVTSELNATLTSFNEGEIGPGHCDDGPPAQQL